MADRRNSPRRYPALGFLAVAAGLALLLPSALSTPRSAPSSLAELAPVPGRSEGAGDLSELGEADGGAQTEGRRPVGPASGTDAPSGPGGRVKHPITKRCVGDPPRQTEDPLSPPCVGHFAGENGGASWRGVTADEVTVLVQMINATDPYEGTPVDCTEPFSPDDRPEDAACKAYSRYFNDRYQTYGRRVRLISKHNTEGALDRFGPFAHVGLGAEGGAAASGSLSAGFIGAARSSYRRYPSHVVTFRPDQEDGIELAATFICAKLASRPARFAGDPTIRTQTRRFGFLLSDSGHARRRDATRERVRELCGVDITAQTEDWQTAAGVARLRTQDVTTVILMVGNTAHATATNNATAMGWFPEWLIPPPPGTAEIDTNLVGRLANPSQWANAFGASLDVRRGALIEQPWYRAFKEGCPECDPPRVGDPGAVQTAAIYDALSLLFYGIQGAGPKLTPQAIDKGLHSIPARPSTDPYRPAAYFAPDNWSFMKDAMMIRWDPAGTPPGSSNAGCYRLPHEGRRFRPADWISGDEDIGMSGPCHGDNTA